MTLKHGTGHSMRFFLALSYTLFVMVGITIVGLAWFSRQEEAADDALLLQLEERARLMAGIQQFEMFSISGDITPEILTSLNRTLRVLYVTRGLEIQRLSDLGINNDQRNMALSLSRSAMEKGYTVSQKSSPVLTGGYEMLYSAAPIFGPDHSVSGVVCLVLPLAEFRSSMNVLRMDLMWLVGGLALVGLLLGYGLAAMFSQPIKRASQMAEKVAGGDYHIRLPLQGPTELVDLAKDLNQMASELENQSKLRSQIMANVAHELARPLGALVLGVDSLRAGAIKESALADDLLSEISRTLQRMDTLVEDLELASHIPQDHLKLHLRPTSMDKVLKSAYSRHRLTAESRGIQLKLDLPETLLPVMGDDFRIAQICGNLIDNALKFTPSGGEVIISAFNAGQMVEIEISDDGMGIPEEDLPHLFEPFYQGRNSQTISRGVGLGLSIVNRLVLAHGGQLAIENHQPCGTSARVWLPAAPGAHLLGD